MPAKRELYMRQLRHLLRLHRGGAFQIVLDCRASHAKTPANLARAQRASPTAL
jgi:hypothetical protein